MNWDTLKLILDRLAEQLGFHRVRSDHCRARAAETSMSDLGTDERPTAPSPRFSRKAPRVFTAYRLLKAFP
jgi:hypothetical protein